MVQYAEECRTLGIPFIWDPGQQCARMNGDELRAGLDGSAIVICNDYEFELIRQKTGLDEDGVFARTRRAHRDPRRAGIHGRATARATVAVPAVPPHEDRRPDRRRRCVPRRAAERARDRRGPRSVLPARQHGGDLRAGAPWRSEPLLHLGRVRRRATARTSAQSDPRDFALGPPYTLSPPLRRLAPSRGSLARSHARMHSCARTCSRHGVAPVSRQNRRAQQGTPLAVGLGGGSS